MRNGLGTKFGLIIYVMTKPRHRIRHFKDVAPLENGLFNFPESLYERSTTCAYAKSKIKWEAPGEISEISPSSLTTPPKF